MTYKAGKPLPDRWVGFGKNNKIVRGSLTPALHKHLTDLDKWFSHLENMRHAVGHRIPLYIPPYYVPDDKLDEYHAIGERIYESIKLRNYSQVERLEKKQGALTRFEPITTHSFFENAPVVFFHFQMISDYKIVEEVGRVVLGELDLNLPYTHPVLDSESEG